MQLFIAEKPSLAKAIYTELGVIKRGDGFVECKGDNVVTWCFGHLLEQAEPDAYLPESVPKTKKGKKVWRMQDLPIFPSDWIVDVKNDKGVKKQFATIKKLLSRCTGVVNAGDPDREGCLLIDEIIEKCRCTKPVKRFWASAIDPASIRKALAGLQPNEKFRGMTNAALARSRSDWLLGMNLTRAYTLARAVPGGKGNLTVVGRVQTPTLTLVAQRDYAIKNFKPQPYIKIYADLTDSGSAFTAQWTPGSLPAGWSDPEGKLLINLAAGRGLAARLGSVSTAAVLSADTKEKRVAPPRCYSLADIQQEASSKYGFTAEQTLNVCQSLYEKHKVTSYPRTDCGYLPESQLADAPSVLSAIVQTCPAAKPLVDYADTSLKSATWNDKKITAHHGIIPTAFSAKWEDLSNDEKRIYVLVLKRYVAQFYPLYIFHSTTVKLDVGGEPFTARGKVIAQKGWKAVYAADERAAAKKGESEPTDKSEDQTLPALSAGQSVSVSRIHTREDQTKPPSAYTEGTLIAAMESIHKAFDDHPEIQARLKESDGIGTPATRAAIISELKRRDYLVADGKKLHATPAGVALLRNVSPKVRSAIMTAQWEEKLKKVEAEQMTVDEFMDELKDFIESEIAAAKKAQEQASSG